MGNISILHALLYAVYVKRYRVDKPSAAVVCIRHCKPHGIITGLLDAHLIIEPLPRMTLHLSDEIEIIYAKICLVCGNVAITYFIKVRFLIKIFALNRSRTVGRDFFHPYRFLLSV